jgi:DNA-nicking Smr family endonuclease
MDEDWLELVKGVDKLKSEHITYRKNVKATKQQNISSNNYSHKIDLHGLTEDQAFTKLKDFLQYAKEAKFKEVVVVTGKGKIENKGIIKTSVPRWLELTELKDFINGYSFIIDSYGESGSIRVQIKRR